MLPPSFHWEIEKTKIGMGELALVLTTNAHVVNLICTNVYKEEILEV